MPQVAFFEKKFVPLSEAKVGVMTHALNYGTACFEGIRGNWNAKEGQIYLFRLKEHYERLHKSCRRLIWLNPLLGAPGYEPLVQGIRTVLPCVDDFLPAGGGGAGQGTPRTGA